MAGLAVAASLSFANAIHPEATATKPARIANEILSSPVIHGGGNQPDLSPELMHDVSGPETDGQTRAEASEPSPASAVALFADGNPGPVLRGLYTGAARTLVQSHGKSRIVWLEVTAYCPCPKCCGPAAAGITASGKPVSYNGGAFVAADAEQFPFGAKLKIPGYHQGQTVEVLDRGSAIKGARVDVYFPTHEQAEEWGRQWLPVVMEK